MTKYLFGDLVRNCKEKVDRDNNPYEYFVAGDHMESERPKLTMRGRFDEADVGPAFIRIFKPGQVLYGSRRTYLKKVSVADFEGVTSNVTFVLETKDESILPQRLLPFLLLSDRFTSYSIGKSKGSTNPYVLFSDLADFEIDLPEPKTVAEIADIMCAAERLKEDYRSLIATCDDVVKSQFVEMFGDPIDNTFHKPIASFSDLGKWQSGGTPARSNTAYFEGDIDWYSAGELNGFHLRSSIERITIEALNQSAAKLYPAGSLLVGMYDTAALKMGVLDKAAASNQACACLIPNDSVLVEWLYTAISIMKPHLLGQRKGCRQKNLSLKTIKGFNLPIADKAEQRDFAVFFHSVDKSKFAVQKALDELNATTKKILNQELGLGDV